MLFLLTFLLKYIKIYLRSVAAQLDVASLSVPVKVCEREGYIL